jgi:hypothetical protein
MDALCGHGDRAVDGVGHVADPCDAVHRLVKKQKIAEK